MGKTLVIVDDHAGFRDSARLLLEEDGFEVLGEAEDGRSGIAAVRSLRPDIVLLDICLPDTDGMAVAKELTAHDDAPVIVLTSSHDREDFGEAIETSGAHAFVPKGELSGETLSEAVA
jgi:DNA-binding NarL/FixJ family response regulator